MNKNIPDKLKKGDTVAIICPSAPINLKAKHRIEKSISIFEEMGYKVITGDHIYGEDGQYTSGSIDERLSDLHHAFENKAVKMIICGIGGNHSNQIINRIDYELIKNNPKIFIGYSDITVIHYALNTKGNLITFYGPCAATQFGDFPKILDYTLNSFNKYCTELVSTTEVVIPSKEWTEEFLNWFEKKDTLRARVMVENPGYLWLREGEASGCALPACIMAINRLAGTEYWINPKNKIFIFDILISKGELDESLVDAYVHDLKNLNLFEEIRGLIIGRLSNFSEVQKERLFKNLLEICPKDIPIVAGFDIGHTDPILTIPYEIEVSISSKSRTVTFGDF